VGFPDTRVGGLVPEQVRDFDQYAIGAGTQVAMYGRHQLQRWVASRAMGPPATDERVAAEVPIDGPAVYPVRPVFDPLESVDRMQIRRGHHEVTQTQLHAPRRRRPGARSAGLHPEVRQLEEADVPGFHGTLFHDLARNAEQSHAGRAAQPELPIP